MKHRWVLMVVAGVLLGAGREGACLVMFSKTGDWPKSWPEELEPLRNSARTIDVATGTQEHVYEIRFDDREEFERDWPVILSVKSPGAPLTLHSIKAKGKNTVPWFEHTGPVVQIYAPMNGIVPMTGRVSDYDVGGRIDPEKLETAIKEGHALTCGPPWPDEIIGDDGCLPEYVASVTEGGRIRWRRVDNLADVAGFHFRCRVEIHLVIDGEIIDLNRIKLPADTPIVDRRLLD